MSPRRSSTGVIATRVVAVSLLGAVGALAACGARSQIPDPAGAGGAPASCPEPSTVVTASIGGPIVDQFRECFAWPSDEPCPSPAAAEKKVPLRCMQLWSVDCGPEREGGSCCYLVSEVCGLS